MYTIDGAGRLRYLQRRPMNACNLEADGWVFLPQNRRWDADERESVSIATGLYDLDSTYRMDEGDLWWKENARISVSKRTAPIDAANQADAFIYLRSQRNTA